MSTGNPTFQEKMFTHPKSNTSSEMTLLEAQQKYCNHVFEKIIWVGYPRKFPTENCVICGISKGDVK